MSQPKKLTDSEFAEIKQFQTKQQETIVKLGLLQAEKMELDQLISNYVEKEKQIREEWLSVQNLGKSITDKILKTYGEGNLNMETGTFAPIATMVTPEQRKV